MKPLKTQLIEYLAKCGDKPLRPRALAKRFGVPKHERQMFEDLLEQVVAEGKARKTKEGRVANKAADDGARSGLLRGILKVTERGGWFVPHADDDLPRDAYTFERSERDLFVFPEHLADAHDGDEVLVRPSRRLTSRGARTGSVEKVVVRKTTTFVGTYIEDHHRSYVRVDGKVFEEPIYVGDPGAKGAQPGDKVVIEMVRFPSPARSGEAVITQLLGARGEPGVDQKIIIHEFGLPDEFPEAVIAAAREQVTQFDETQLEDRTDFTNETVITIDPVDARDFDDAISLTRSEDGHWHLGVHIADVAHFVPPKSVLDQEAARRGTSVYLPGRVLPMIPEAISNALASLQLGRVRFTKSVVIEFDAEGVPLHTEFHRSAIKSARRFAYEEIMPIVRDPSAALKDIAEPVVALIGRMHTLAMKLRGRRFEQGALELYLPETKLKLDSDGRVVGVNQMAHDESHQIIEEFMLAANSAVAVKLTEMGLPFLRRNHGRPDITKLRVFAEFVDSLGFHLKKAQSRHELQRLLNKVKGQDFEQAVNFALLRSLKQAEYSPIQEGHYALAMEDYCHFTSPIRRYPDLTVHRLLDAVIRREKSRQKGNRAKTVGMSVPLLLRLGLHCSATERRATQAERELIRMKLLRLFEGFNRERVFEVVITGVEKRGVFARSMEYPVDGFIAAHKLADGTLDFDRVTRTLIGRRGAVFRLGDRLQVRIGRLDADERVLEWTPVTHQPKSRVKTKKAKSSSSKTKDSLPKEEKRPKRRTRKIVEEAPRPKRKKAKTRR